MRKLGIAYFTASVDPLETNKEFAKSLDVDYPILSNPDKSVAKAYGVLRPDGGFANRWTFYIDKEGVVKSIDKEGKTKDQGAAIVKKLEELGVPKKKG